MWSIVRRVLFSLIITTLTVRALGQGGSFTRQVSSGTVANGGTGQVIPYALVTVCTSAGTGTPCSPIANIYADKALTQPLSNPFAADINGLYSFFVATGEYLVQESAPVGAGYSYSESFLIFSNGTGTVSSVGLALPSSVFSVTNSPVTLTGTLTGSFIAQSANSVFGNCSGSSAIPSFCSLIANQIPSTLNSTTISGTLTTTATGNTLIGGTLGVTGAATLSSTLGVTGNTTVGGTLGVAGNSTFSGTLGAVGNITSSAGYMSANLYATAPYFNATTGYQIGGSYGSSGQFLESTGTGTQFGSPYYQTINLNNVAQTQRPTINFSSLFNATDSSSPAETTISLASTGVTAGTYANPVSVTVTATGQLSAITAASGTAADYYFTFTSCTVPSGAGAECQGTVQFTSGGNTSQAFPAMPDINYEALCDYDFGTATNDTAIAHNIAARTTSGFGYSLGNATNALGSGASATGMCHLHHS